MATEYLGAAGLLPYLEALGFHQVGYGCTTCIGNSGPLPEHVSKEIEEKDLTVAAVLSGNRNFEGRINPPLVKANYLASPPPLVVAYAIAGTVNINFETDPPLAYDPNGIPVYLRDIWPMQDEIKQVEKESVRPEMFKKEYSGVLEGAKLWKELEVPEGTLYEWIPTSTYIQEPPLILWIFRLLRLFSGGIYGMPESLPSSETALLLTTSPPRQAIFRQRVRQAGT